jgi:hypothetical protein
MNDMACISAEPLQNSSFHQLLILLEIDILFAAPASLASGIHTPTTTYFISLRPIDDTCSLV